jgi:hypothetical protein
MIHAIKKEEAVKKVCPMSMSKTAGRELCYAEKCMAWIPCVSCDPIPDKGYCGFVLGGRIN